LRKIGMSGGETARFYNLEVSYFELSSEGYHSDQSTYVLNYEEC
jgi:hypothetical protein